MASLIVSKVCLSLMEGIDFSKQSRWRSVCAFAEPVVASEALGSAFLPLDSQPSTWGVGTIAGLQQALAV